MRKTVSWTVQTPGQEQHPDLDRQISCLRLLLKCFLPALLWSLEISGPGSEELLEYVAFTGRDMF